MVAVNLTARVRHERRPRGPGNGSRIWFVSEVVAVTDGELAEFEADDLDEGHFDWVAWDEWEVGES